MLFRLLLSSGVVQFVSLITFQLIENKDHILQLENFMLHNLCVISSHINYLQIAVEVVFMNYKD